MKRTPQENEAWKFYPESEAIKKIKKITSLIAYERGDLFNTIKSNGNNLEDYFLLATDRKKRDIINTQTKKIVVDNKTGKMFFAIPNTNTKLFKQLLSENHNMYEIIMPDDDVKLYFDLEADLKDDEDDAMYRNYFIKALSYILNNDFDIVVEAKDILVLNSSRQNYFSNHLVYQSIKFNNMKELKQFINYLSHRFNNANNDNETKLFGKLFFGSEKKLIMDIHPYGSYQNIRCINQSKLNKPYILKATTDIHPFSSLIGFNVDGMHTIDIDSLGNKKVSKTIKQTKNNVEQKLDLGEHFVNFDFTIKQGNTLMATKNLTYADLKALPLYKQYLYLIPNNNSNFSDFLNIGFAIRGAGGVVNDWRQWALLYPKNDDDEIHMEAFEKFLTEGQIFNISTLKRLAKKSQPDFFKTGDELFRTYFDLDLENIKIIEEKCDFVSQEGTTDANNILDDNKFIILHAYLGRGKTTAIKRLIKEKNYKKFLFISPRVSFSLFISQEFGIDNYTDALLDDNDKDKICINKSKKLIISVESIQKINIENNYECIFLDESEAILAQFSSPTMKSKYLDCFNKLNDLINKADKVVCADAFLTNRTINFIKAYNKPITLIKNNTAPIKRHAIRIEKYDDIKKHLIETIKENKKPYICSSTKSTLENFEAGKDFMPELFTGSIIYFGGYKRDDKMFRDTLKNINTTWKDAKWVATTPTNTIGCSYSIKNDFDNVYMLCTAPTCSVRDMFQMSMRVRHIKENKLFFCLPETKRNTKGTRDEIYFQSLENFENYNREKIQLTIDECNKFITEDKSDQHILKIMVETFKEWEQTPKQLREIIYFNLFEMYLSNTHYEKMYYNFLEKCGYSYEKPIEKPTKGKKEAKKEEQKAVEEIEAKAEEWVEEYNKIKNIGDSEIDDYVLKEKKMQSTVCEKLIKEKYYYKKLIKGLDIGEESKHFYSYINPYRKHLLLRAYDEKHCKSIISILEKEISDSNKCREMVKGNVLKLAVIRDFVKILKINNSFDTITKINRTEVDSLVDYVHKNIKKISTIFNIADIEKMEEKQKYRLLFPVIEKCFNNWSGCNLITEKRDRNKKSILYSLSGIDYYNIIKDKSVETDFLE
jgi:hypothetical protein